MPNRINDIANSSFDIFRKGLLLFIYHTGNRICSTQIITLKTKDKLVEVLISNDDEALRKTFSLTPLVFDDVSSWKQFTDEIISLSRGSDVSSDILLGTVMEVMQQLNWQANFNLRRFLVLFLTSDKELSHFKIAITNTPHMQLLEFYESCLPTAISKAKIKSKLQ